MKCHFCKNECDKEERANLFGASCDTCQRVVCRNCAGKKSGLLANEVRVLLQTTQRTLMYFCYECTDAMLSINFSEMKKEFTKMNTKLASMENEIKSLRKQVNTSSMEKTGYKDITKEIVNSIQASIEKQTDNIGNTIQKAIEDMNDNTQKMTNGLMDMIREHKTQKPIKQQNISELEEATASKMNEIINICKEDETRDSKQKSYTANTVMKPKKQLMGVQGTCSSVTNLSAAVERKWIFLDNLAPNTEEEHIRSHLSEKYIPIIACEKMVSKDQQKASFKIAINPQHEENIMSAEIWPLNVKVKPFIVNWGRRYGGFQHSQYQTQNFPRQNRKRWNR